MHEKYSTVCFFHLVKCIFEYVNRTKSLTNFKYFIHRKTRFHSWLRLQNYSFFTKSCNLFMVCATKTFIENVGNK